MHTHGHLLTLPDVAGAPSPDRVSVEPLLPCQMRDLTLRMRSPREPGIYESKWRLSTAQGLFFGDDIWVIVTVERSGTLGLMQQMSSFAVGADGNPATATVATTTATTTTTTQNPFSPRKYPGEESKSRGDQMD